MTDTSEGDRKVDETSFVVKLGKLVVIMALLFGTIVVVMNVFVT